MEMVRALGGEVLAADGPEAARRQVAEHDEIDVVVTDVIMPGGRGDRLAEELIQHRSGLGVVLMSGYSAELGRAPGGAHPSFELLQKPFGLTALGEALHRALARSRDHGPSGS
jgi:DNA-binding NtrC family response regulator